LLDTPPAAAAAATAGLSPWRRLRGSPAVAGVGEAAWRQHAAVPAAV